MRIHTDKIGREDVWDAARKAGVTLEKFDNHGSRKRDHAFEVLLSGSSNRQAMGKNYDAATWDQWGVFIAHLFHVDPDAIAGEYNGAENFHWTTAGRFASGAMPFDTHQQHRFEFAGRSLDEMFYGYGCTKCSAAMRRSA